MNSHAKPLPRLSPDNRPFWEAAKRHELMLPFCTACGRAHLPPGPVCPFCLEERLEWRRASGRGVVSTWVVVHKEWFPAFHDDIPYNVVQVELAEGPRLTASVVGLPNAALQVGLPVEVAFEDVSEDIALPRFRPAAS